MVDREARVETFLAGHGWSGSTRGLLAGDASFRRYDRLTLDGRHAVLMDAPPPMEDVRPFIRIARHLNTLGLSAPRILAADEDGGFLLLEDLGDETFTRVLETAPEREVALYELAVDVLAHLHNRPRGETVPDGLTLYDDDKLLEEAFLLTDWYLPAVTGSDIPATVRDRYRDIWLTLFEPVHAQPVTLVLRDYHVDNLLVLDGRDGVAACGVLDFQDAVAGAAAYDLMSLLEDARRDIEPDLKAAMLERYFVARPDLTGPSPARDAFETAFVILAAQRHAKVIGIFTRLCLRDEKPDYLRHIPRLWRLLETSLRDPAMAGLKAWFDEHLPNDLRRIPECPAAT